MRVGIKTGANLDPSEEVRDVERDRAIHSAGTRYILQGVQINGLDVRVGCMMFDAVFSDWVQCMFWAKAMAVSMTKLGQNLSSLLPT